MARKIITWDDFSGGFFLGRAQNRQPTNTWRGIDVTTSAADGYLVARPDRRQELTTFSVAGGAVPTDWGLSTKATWGSAPIVFESQPVAGPSEPVTCFAWAELGGTPSSPNCRLVARGTATYTAAPTAGKAPISNPTVELAGQIATVYCAFATPSSTDGFLSAPIADGEIVALAMNGGGVNVRSTPEPLRILEPWSEWLLGASTNSNRLYFGTKSLGDCDFTTADTSGYFEVGDGSPIIAIIPTRGQVYIGKRSGWWALAGVLDDINSVTLRQVAETLGPPGSYITHDQAHREAAILTDMGILYPFDISYDGAARYLVPGPAGANGFAAFTSSRAQPVAFWPPEMGLDMGNMHPTGCVDLVDNAVWFQCAGNPAYDVAELPYSVGDIINTSFMLKGDRWECWSGRGISDATYPNSVPCRDLRRLDYNPEGRQQIFWFHSTTGATRTITIHTTNLYADLPQSFTPVKVNLASYSSNEPFRVVAVNVVYDWGPVDSTTLTGSAGVASLAVDVKVIGPVDGDNPESASSSLRRDIPVTDSFAGTDVYADRKATASAFRTDDLPSCVEAEIALTLAGVRVRRVHMEIDTDDWGN